MDQSKQGASSTRIFSASAVEPKDPDEERLERGHNFYLSIIKGLSERDAHDALNVFVSKGQAQHKDIQYGLLYNILVDPLAASKCWQDMLLVSRDGLSTIVVFVINMASAKWIRITESSRQQIVWLTKELVKQNVKDSDELYLLLLRQVVGGDLSPRNVWLAENLLDIFVENRSWLEKSPSPRDLVPSVVYTYLRLIIDHKDSSFSILKQREVDLCISLLREKWAECMVIGRDLVRILQLVARIPQFETLWRDIFVNPSALSPSFTGVMQLMSIPSKRHIILSRVTPDMEKKLAFLMLHVTFGSQKRYQEWFQKTYLSTPESQTLRCDIIRFICVCLHPSNEQIQSKVLPRWAVIGWLLTTCTSNVAASDAKLALFLDWLVFNGERDNIMNIEPAILVMYNSMRQHPAISATLLDFMCRIMPNFCPKHSVEIREGIYCALRTILEKEVLQIANPPGKNFDFLFNNPKLDKELRALVHQNFQEFCNTVKEEPPVRDQRFGSIDNGSNHISDGVLEGTFSDDEDDLPLSKLQDDDSAFLFLREPPAEKPVDITEHFCHLLPEVKDFVISLQAEKNQEKRCDVLSELLGLVIQDNEFDQDGASALAACLCHILSDQFTNIFPQSSHQDTEQAIEESSKGEVLFVIFRFLSDIAEGDHRRNQLFLLLGEMYAKQPRTGYLLLYFLKVSKSSDDKMVLYKDFCKNKEVSDLKSCLLKDLKLCEDDDVRLFTYLIPDIYTHFSTIVVGSAELVHMIVESIDGTQLQDLICQILQGHLIIFTKKELFLSILNESLKWESIEQYFLWQLVTAHNIPIEHMLPILPMLEYSAHAEALTSLMVLLKQESPTADLLRPMLCRKCKKSDYFVVSVLKYWAQEYEDRLADMIKTELTRVNGVTKRRTKESKKDQPTVDQVLAHLDHMRQVCRNISFLNHEQIQHALQQVQATATDSQKSKFTDLLALAEDIEDIRTTRVLRGRRGTNTSPKMMKSKRHVDSDSNSDMEEEENSLRHPPKKKKKISQPVLEDDSD